MICYHPMLKILNIGVAIKSGQMRVDLKKLQPELDQFIKYVRF